MRKTAILAVVFIAMAAFAQQETFTTKLGTHSHGGFPMQEFFGANKTDAVLMNVYCDAWLDSEFFFGPPRLTGDNTAFTKTASELVSCPKNHDFASGANCWYQQWVGNVSRTGDNYVWAQYLFLGTLVHYEIHVTASETQGERVKKEFGGQPSTYVPTGAQVFNGREFVPYVP